MSAPARIAVGLGTSLEKFFTDTAVPRCAALRLSGLRGEVVSFQMAYQSPQRGALTVELSGPLAEWTAHRRIDLAHVEHPTYGAKPEFRIGRAPGFYPDPLIPEAPYLTYPGQTRGVWFTISIPPQAKGGAHRLAIRVKNGTDTVARLSVVLDVIPVALPKQRVKVYHWFHNDCLMSHYRFAAWSPEHWRIAEAYIRNAVAHGNNTMLTPVFTPPLDTAVGTERPTVQLTDVTVVGKDRYRFGFARLERWVDLCRRCGVTDFVISHLTTQWGAKFAPKVVAEVAGRPRRIFGWDTRSDSPGYRAFLLQFLPALTRCLRRKGILSRTYLHVSDEPHSNHIPEYSAARELLRQGAPELPVVEALSDYAFYERGHVDRPCPATNHVEPFLEHRVPHLWCYYCCGQVTDVANRFMDFPSARNRILGWQLFKFGFEGFLQWGYNHWYSGLTDTLLDPYTTANGGRVLPPGDGFVVYPGKDGPVDSLRWEVFRECLQDMRALELLRTLSGKAPSRAASRLLALTPIRSMAEYPRSDRWLLRTREEVNREVWRLVR